MFITLNRLQLERVTLTNLCFRHHVRDLGCTTEAGGESWNPVGSHGQWFRDKSWWVWPVEPRNKGTILQLCWLVCHASHPAQDLGAWASNHRSLPSTTGYHKRGGQWSQQQSPSELPAASFKEDLMAAGGSRSLPPPDGCERPGHPGKGSQVLCKALCKEAPLTADSGPFEVTWSQLYHRGWWRARWLGEWKRHGYHPSRSQ